MKILYVCTANICRSPSAEYLMRDASAALAIPEVTVGSAGVQALEGAPACDVAPAMLGRASGHRARALTAQAVQWADLILTASREHQRAVSDLDPAARTKMYTVRQSGRIAAWLQYQQMVEAGRGRAAAGERWQTQFPPDDPRAAVTALADNRDEWVLEEMDAARGSVPLPPPQVGKRHAAVVHHDDVPDPHSEEPALHPVVYQQIWDATSSLAGLLRAASRDSSPR